MKKRKKASKSPCQLSLAHMRKAGWDCTIVERFVKFGGMGGIRKDAFGFADILCLRTIGDKTYCAAIQTTSTPHINDHLAKLRSPEVINRARMWLMVPNHLIYLQGWSLKGDTGKRKTFTLREVLVTLETLNHRVDLSPASDNS